MQQPHYVYNTKKTQEGKDRRRNSKIEIKLLESWQEHRFRRLFQRLSEDPLGSQLSQQSTDGLETGSPDRASGRQNDRCVAEAQHMLYEGPGLARMFQHCGSCEHASEDAM